MKKKVAPARQAAFEVLGQVVAGGYASDLLRDATRHLAARDAGLAGQLVLGSLRVQNQLDYLVELHSGRPAASLDLVVQMALRVAIFQIRYLERIPTHAAVDDSVEFVKQHKRAASGLTNAVLRKVKRDPIVWPNDALAYACPEWLLNRWKANFGLERALAIASAALKEPEQFIRVKPGETPPDDAEPTEIESCYRLAAPARGNVRLHDISSQTIVPLLQLEASHSYLDLCSAPGNKTAQAMESHPLFAVACDISERRLHAVKPEQFRVVLDASDQLPFDRKFDRILIDAPCSGTGTIGRNPEIKWRLTKADLVRQHSRQVDILKRAAGSLEDDGKILFATCSLEKEENDEVIIEAAAAQELRVELEMRRLPGRDRGDGFYAALLVKARAVR